MSPVREARSPAATGRLDLSRARTYPTRGRNESRKGSGMTLRDLLLVLGAVPLLGVVVMRLAAEMGYASDAPPADALTSALGLFGFVFVVYVALTLRSIASATRDIL